MTRGEGLLSGRVAAWMGSVGPATGGRLQVPPVGRVDKGAGVTFREGGGEDGQSGAWLLRENCRSLPLVDDKGRGVTFREGGGLDGQRGTGYWAKTADPSRWSE